MNDHYVELETRIAFQDDAIEQLNQVIINQQQQLDKLSSEIKILKQGINQIQPSLNAAPEEETPPPHY